MKPCLYREELEELRLLFWRRGYRIAVFTDIKGYHVEERLDLLRMALEGRLRANGADFGSLKE